MKIGNKLFFRDNLILKLDKPLMFVSSYLFLFLEINSIVSKITIKVKQITASWVAELKSFIPSQRLKIPNVIVSIAKNSTVPKSEIVSIRTRENPPIIAGLAIGRATLKKIELPLNLANSYKLTGVERNETLDKK